MVLDVKIDRPRIFRYYTNRMNFVFIGFTFFRLVDLAEGKVVLVLVTIFII